MNSRYGTRKFNYHQTWKTASSGMLRREALAGTDVSAERIAYMIRVTRTRERGKALAVISNRGTSEEMLSP
jgi:hypothetical protein